MYKFTKILAIISAIICLTLLVIAIAYTESLSTSEKLSFTSLLFAVVFACLMGVITGEED